VFGGGREGHFFALGGMVASGAMSFELGGKQPIAVSAGGALIVFDLPE